VSDASPIRRPSFAVSSTTSNAFHKRVRSAATLMPHEMCHECLRLTLPALPSAVPAGVVSFERRALDDEPPWGECDTGLAELTVSEDGYIEDVQEECLQIDFANKCALLLACELVRATQSLTLGVSVYPLQDGRWWCAGLRLHSRGDPIPHQH
jgi:hypothetical protein